MTRLHHQQVRLLGSHVVAHTELQTIRLEAIHLTSRPFEAGPMGADVTLQVDTTRTSPVTVLVTSIYAVHAWRAEDSDGTETVRAGGEEDLWTVEATVTAQYAADPDCDLHGAHLLAFGATSGALAVHPYAREIVQTAVSRAGYPPFTLSMLKSDWDSDMEGKSELEVDADDLILALELAMETFRRQSAGAGSVEDEFAAVNAQAVE